MNSKIVQDSSLKSDILAFRMSVHLSRLIEIESSSVNVRRASVVGTISKLRGSELTSPGAGGLLIEYKYKYNIVKI